MIRLLAILIVLALAFCGVVFLVGGTPSAHGACSGECISLEAGWWALGLVALLMVVLAWLWIFRHPPPGDDGGHS